MGTVQPTARRKRIAFLFRYGIKDHAELHEIIPEVVERLGREADVVYIGPNKDRIPKEYLFPGVRYVGVPFHVNRASSRDKLVKTLLWYLWLPFLALYGRLWKADLIWIDESIPLVGWIVELGSGRPVALTVVDFFMEVYREKYPALAPLSKLVLRLERRAWRKSVGLITRAGSMRRYLVEQGVDPAKIRTIRDTFSLETYQPRRSVELRRKYGFAENDIVLVHHGILHPNKGIGRVLDWMVPLLKKDPHLKFLVIGGGPELPELKAVARREGLQPQVVFTGWLMTTQEVGEHLGAADIGLVMRIGQFTDHFHVTGTLVHCLMCGLPVLAARLEGVSEIVTEGEEGCLFDPASRDLFVQGLEKLKADPALRARMGRKGRARAVKEFDPKRVVDTTLEALRAFLG